MRALLDVNVLLALIDTVHPFHDAAHLWFAGDGRQAWATCPIVQNGVVRIASSARYPNSFGRPALVIDRLSEFCAAPEHALWPDDSSILEPTVVEPAKVTHARQITDTYLLALAVCNGGRLATFDRRLSTVAVRGGMGALWVIEA